MFCLKTEDRDLWLCADSMQIKQHWIAALEMIIKEANAGPAAALADPPKEWEIDFKQIQILDKVGDGAFGEVFKGRLWGTEVAVKCIKGDFTEKALSDLKKEMTILSQIRHPNIVLYIGCCTKPPNVCIITEWCERGSVFDLIHKKNVIINTRRMIQIALDAAQGMNYLHSQERRIIHRDLKADNLFVSKHWTIKVGDFGLSHVRETMGARRDGNIMMNPGPAAPMGPLKSMRVDQSEKGQYGIFGTPQWMAPEVMEGLAYNSKIDIYSFGIVLCEIVSRSMPFADRYSIESFTDVVDAVLDDGAVPTIPAWCEQTFKPLILRCLDRDPSKRPSFNDIVRYLRTLLEKSDAELFETQDIPRLQHMLSSNERAKQEQAATEIADFAEDTRKLCLHCGHEPQMAANADRICSSGFLSRLAALLSSSSERVQISSCRALLNLLRLAGIRSKPEEKQAVCSPSTLRALLNMTSSRNPELAEISKRVLIEVTSDAVLSDKVFLSLDVERGKKLSKLLAGELMACEERIKKESTALEQRKAQLLDFVAKFNMDDKKSVLDAYDLREVIGRGMYSTINVCIHKATGRRLVIKTTPTPPNFDKQLFQDEYELLSSIRHPCVISLEDCHYFAESSKMNLVMEHAIHGEFIDWIIQRGFISEQEVSRFFGQLLSGIAHLHSLGVVHRGCKPENILVTANGGDVDDAVVKLSDFSFTSLLSESDIKADQSHSLLTFCSTAPEIIKGSQYDERSDIFGLGVLLFILLSGLPPFCGAEERIGKLVKSPFWGALPQTKFEDPVPFPQPHFGSVTEDAKDLIASMLRINPAERPSAVQCLQHPWIVNVASLPMQPLNFALLSLRDFIKTWKNRFTMLVPKA